MPILCELGDWGISYRLRLSLFLLRSTVVDSHRCQAYSAARGGPKRVYPGRQGRGCVAIEIRSLGRGRYSIAQYGILLARGVMALVARNL